MSESSAKIYVIAGATRGIGLSLVNDVASRDPSAIIYAGARDPSSAGASQLKELVAKYPGRITVVKYVSGDKDGNDALAKEIGKKHGRIDTVIANAGIAKFNGKIHETPVHQFEEHFSINTIGALVLFQSVRDLLKASPEPRFVPITSIAGSLEAISYTLDMAPYGVSKAALNWVTRKIHFENEWLVVFPICPGAVDTDMATDVLSMDKSGRLAELAKDIWRTPDAAAGILVDIITASTREKDGGEFHNIEGTRNPW